MILTPGTTFSDPKNGYLFAPEQLYRLQGPYLTVEKVGDTWWVCPVGYPWFQFKVLESEIEKCLAPPPPT